MAPESTLTISVPSEEIAASMHPLPPDTEVIVWDMMGPAPQSRIPIVVSPYDQATAFKNLPGVEVSLIQSQAIGYDTIAAILPKGISYANAAGVHETATSELAVGLLIAVEREIPRFVIEQSQGGWAADHWRTPHPHGLADRRVLILGYGGVGKAIAARLEPFETDITIIASTARQEGQRVVHGIDELPDLLPNADIVILALPGGAATVGIIDDAALSAMPDGALLLNIGRGGLVDTDALIEHTRRGRIRAALDVTDPEPLPAGHPLWTMPGVLITPHMGGGSGAGRPRLARLVREQATRMLAGRPAVNVVLGPGSSPV